MKCAIIIAAIAAVSSAQFNYRAPAPQYNQFPAPSPSPFAPSLAPFVPPRPTYAPLPTPSRPVVVGNRNSDQAANIIRYENDIGPDGSYAYAFDTDNGISAQAKGTPKNLGGNPPETPVVSEGSFSWNSPEGQPIVITWIADEYGYRASGDAIPTSPPIPEAILRSLQYNAKNPQQQK